MLACQRRFGRRVIKGDARDALRRLGVSTRAGKEKEMKKITSRVSLVWTPLALLFSAFLTPGPAQGQTTYKIQPIVKLGDKVGDAQIRADSVLWIGALNDAGQLVFIANNAPGVGMLVQYADGQLTPIVVAGGDAPGGKWPQDVGLYYSLVSMNQLGNVVFVAADSSAPLLDNFPRPLGTFLWDYKARKVTSVASEGMPAGNSLTLESGGGFGPMLNNPGDIAFPAYVKNAAGQAQPGIFFLGRDKKILPVALPDQGLPDGEKVVRAVFPTINDAGAVAFLVRLRPTGRPTGVYLWESGAITKLAGIPADVAGGEKFGAFRRAWVNNKDRHVLIIASLNQEDPDAGPFAFYRYADGKLAPVAVPDQEMPGGGKLQTVLGEDTAASFANDAGQHAFVAQLEDGTTAAYLLEPDNQIRLILRSGTVTDLGRVTGIGHFPDSLLGVGLNNKGQVALAVAIAGGPDTIVLLTPTTP
jgi:hypothetical protein